jgi:viroplasmin and RNaseH domain-containing protein
MYINDLTKSVLNKSSPLLFADDTSFIIADLEETKFKFHTNETFNEVNKWFYSNLLTLNCDKIYVIQFETKTVQEISIKFRLVVEELLKPEV